MKLITVVLDGLSYSVAKNTMGYMLAQCEQEKSQLYHFACELPSMSRPLYECILTGDTPVKSGIIHNQVCRLSSGKSVFHYAKEAGLTTAAAAYSWVSELYNNAPFDPPRDRHTSDPNLPIQHGHFYYGDDYPDSHLFEDAEHLRRQYNPDFLFVHSMNIDSVGHQFGVNSKEYRNQARKTDVWLSEYLNVWIAEGYQIMVTADHGMNEDNSHGGNFAEEREVPLFVFGSAFSLQECTISQTQLCGTMNEILKVPHDKPVCWDLLKAIA